MSYRLTTALLAGAVGTVALWALVMLRNRSLGHPPPYASRFIAARLAERFLQRPLAPAEARKWGSVMRMGYGPLLGVSWALVRESVPDSVPLVWRGLLLGVGVLTFEHLAFPLLRATAPARTWTRAEHLWLTAQTLVFGVVTEAVLRALGE